MAGIKRLLVCAAAGVLLAFGAVFLAGCGGQVAATWAHGQVAEDEVTSTIESMRSAYGLTDDSAWASFVKKRSYDEDASSKEGDGTVAELREYVINQMIRQDVIDHEIEAQNIEVTDEELDAYVEQQREQVESQYMAGVFESYLERMGYSSIDEFREQARETLAEQKLRQQATGSTDDADAWNEYVDGLVENAQVTINEMPTGLSYDVDLSADGGTEDDTGSETGSDSGN